MKIFSTIFYSLFTLLLLGVAGLFLIPLLPIDNNIQIKIVESGSMEPAIMTGSLVVVVPQKSYQLSDVITFESTGADVPTTHRIVNIEDKEGTLWFTTKGDANEEADTAITPLNSVIGKVSVAVPYIGFILDFARQPLGFAFLIVLPALLIIVGEIEKIWVEIRTKRIKAREKDIETRPIQKNDGGILVEVKETIRMIEIGRPISIYESIPRVRHLPVTSFSSSLQYRSLYSEIAVGMFIAVTSFWVVSLGFVGTTVSYFNDTEASKDNMFTASALDFVVIADGDTYYFTDQILDDEDGGLISIISPATESADVQYSLHVEKIAGSDIFCSAIVAHAASPFVYSGKLLSIDQSLIDFDGAWSLLLSLDDTIVGYGETDECVVDLVYTAWNVDAQQGTGYSDEERVRLEFYAPATTPLPLLPTTFEGDTSASSPQEKADISPIENATSSSDVLETTSIEVPPGEVIEAISEEPVTTGAVIVTDTV